MSDMFKKAKSAAEELKALGYSVEFSTHPTPFGNSAYVYARKSDGVVYIIRGFRLSDHGVGERRKGTDEVPTVIDDETVTVQSLVDMCIVTDAELSDVADKAADRRAAELEKARAHWIAAPGKIRRRFKGAGNTDDERALALLRQGTKW